MKVFKISIGLLISLSLLITSCASKPSELTATFVSPSMYHTYDCDQITKEMQRWQGQVTELTGKQSKIYKNDQTMGLVGTFLLWPLYFFIKGDGEVASQLKTAKGTLAALQQASVEKKCGF